MNCKDIAELTPLYLSGELPEEQRSLFDSHLAGCRACAGAIERQLALDARLRDAVSTELPDATAIERRVHRSIVAERSRRIAIVTAAAAVLFAAVLGYRALRPDRLYIDAALDHRLEVMEHQPRRWRSGPAEIETLAARYQLADVAALGPPGYRLEHAKMCGIGGQPALHLVYTNGSQEVSVYIRRTTGSGGNRTMRTLRVGSEHLAGFQTDRLEAVVATAGSSAECSQFARFAAGVL